jgi:hypothetical protein
VDEWVEDGRASFYDPRMDEGTYGGREVESGEWRGSGWDDGRNDGKEEKSRGMERKGKEGGKLCSGVRE